MSFFSHLMFNNVLSKFEGMAFIEPFKSQAHLAGDASIQEARTGAMLGVSLGYMVSSRSAWTIEGVSASTSKC